MEEKIGNRYYLTGVQLGMLKALIQLETEIPENKDFKEDIIEVLEEVEDKQYLCEKEELHKILKNLK